MNRALGTPVLPASMMAFSAAAIDHRIRPATVHDLPLPVFPNTAKCRPKSLSGSTMMAAFDAIGEEPILTLLSVVSRAYDGFDLGGASE